MLRKVLHKKIKVTHFHTLQNLNSFAFVKTLSIYFLFCFSELIHTKSYQDIDPRNVADIEVSRIFLYKLEV